MLPILAVRANCRVYATVLCTSVCLSLCRL